MLALARANLTEGRTDEAVAMLRRTIEEIERDGPPSEVRRAAELLTRSEMRVARMAADGMKNREIAAELTVTLKAIEFHLANTYRKLRIAGRPELARFFNWTAPVLATFAAG
jgi:DNA-binding NarL/FixJ family response regulator